MVCCYRCYCCYRTGRGAAVPTSRRWGRRPRQRPTRPGRTTRCGGGGLYRLVPTPRPAPSRRESPRAAPAPTGGGPRSARTHAQCRRSTRQQGASSQPPQQRQRRGPARPRRTTRTARKMQRRRRRRRRRRRQRAGRGERPLWAGLVPRRWSSHLRCLRLLKLARNPSETRRRCAEWRTSRRTTRTQPQRRTRRAPTQRY